MVPRWHSVAIVMPFCVAARDIFFASLTRASYSSLLTLWEILSPPKFLSPLNRAPRLSPNSLKRERCFPKGGSRSRKRTDRRRPFTFFGYFFCFFYISDGNVHVGAPFDFAKTVFLAKRDYFVGTKSSEGNRNKPGIKHKITTFLLFGLFYQV